MVYANMLVMTFQVLGQTSLISSALVQIYSVGLFFTGLGERHMSILLLATKCLRVSFASRKFRLGKITVEREGRKEEIMITFSEGYLFASCIFAAVQY